MFMPLLIIEIQINLHQVEQSGLPQHCLSVSAWPLADELNPQQTLRYCLGESVSNRFVQFVVKDQPRLSFAQVAAKQISTMNAENSC